MNEILPRPRKRLGEVGDTPTLAGLCLVFQPAGRGCHGPNHTPGVLGPWEKGHRICTDALQMSPERQALNVCGWERRLRAQSKVRGVTLHKVMVTDGSALGWVLGETSQIRPP